LDDFRYFGGLFANDIVLYSLQGESYNQLKRVIMIGLKAYDENKLEDTRDYLKLCYEYPEYYPTMEPKLYGFWGDQQIV